MNPEEHTPAIKTAHSIVNTIVNLN